MWEWVCLIFYEEYSETTINHLLPKSRGKIASWNYETLKSHCTAGANIRISNIDGDKTDKLKQKNVLVTPAVVEDGFPIPLDKYMALRFFNYCPMQLLSQFVLVYKREVFSLSFKFQDFIRLFSIIETNPSGRRD